jgi:hypothetical protein
MENMMANDFSFCSMLGHDKFVFFHTDERNGAKKNVYESQKMWQRKIMNGRKEM